MFKKKKSPSNNTSTPVDDIINLNSNEFEIETTEEQYKADGSVVIGSRNQDNTYNVNNQVLPPQIDIAARKKAKQDALNSKKKKAVVSEDKQAKRVQSIVALIVLALFAGVYGVFYYYKNIANNKDFTVKKVHVEYGEAASLKISDYVNVENPDEKLYTLDLSDFVPDLIGEYKFKITYSGITKVGIIEVSDTKAPEIETKKITLNPGDTYTPEMFINSCVDLNSCYATFEDGSTIKTAKEFGENNIYLVIKDSFGNQVTKQAILNTKSTNVNYLCSYASNYDYNAGYKLSTTYDITFDKDDNYLSSKKLTIYEFIDHNDYLTYKEKHKADTYSYEDSISRVTHTEDYKQGFNGNTTYSTIRSYLTNSHYTCVMKPEE